MYWYVILLIMTILSTFILIKNRNIFIKCLMSLVLFLSLFVGITASYLTLINFSFSRTIWQKWACWDKYVPNDNFYQMLKVANLGIEREPIEIVCKEPISYTVKLNHLGVRSTPPDLKDWSRINTGLFGCSYTWGTGLNEEQTIAYSLQKMNKESVVNYAFPGNSAASTLLILSLMHKKEVPISRIDHIVYTIRDGHFIRDAGQGRWRFHPRNPRLEISDDGKFSFKGSMAYANDMKYESNNPVDILMQFVYSLNYLINADTLPTEADIDYTARIINYMNQLTTEHLKSKFYLNIWPEHSIDGSVEARMERFKSKLNPKVRILQFPGKLELAKLGGHPDAESAYKMADFLSTSIHPVNPRKNK